MNAIARITVLTLALGLSACAVQRPSRPHGCRRSRRHNPARPRRPPRRRANRASRPNPPNRSHAPPPASPRPRAATATGTRNWACTCSTTRPTPSTASAPTTAGTTAGAARSAPTARGKKPTSTAYRRDWASSSGSNEKRRSLDRRFAVWGFYSARANNPCTYSTNARALTLASLPVGNTAHNSCFGKVQSFMTVLTAPLASSGANIHSEPSARP